MSSEVALLETLRFAREPGRGCGVGGGRLELGISGKGPCGPGADGSPVTWATAQWGRIREKFHLPSLRLDFSYFFISALAVLCYWSSACGSSHGILCPLLLGKLRTFNSEL